jgi:hypothetical protein
MTNDEAGSVTDLYQQEVLNNLAQQAANPSTLPYFSVPGTGTTTDQRQIQANYTLTFDLITSSVVRFADRYLLDKQSAYIQPQLQYAEQWQSAPTNDPDKIVLMQIAYHRALGRTTDREESVLKKFYGVSEPAKASEMAPEVDIEIRRRYYDALHPGWINVGRKQNLPRHACLVGQCGDTYIWVPPDRGRELAEFTLTILDIATIKTPAHGAEKTSYGGTGPGSLTPRENFFNPFSSPAPLP